MQRFHRAADSAGRTACGDTRQSDVRCRVCAAKGAGEPTHGVRENVVWQRVMTTQLQFAMQARIAHRHGDLGAADDVGTLCLLHTGCRTLQPGCLHLHCA